MSTYYMNELDRELLSQPEKIISVRMELLNSDGSMIQSLDASLISISLSIDADSEIRRTGTINIIPEFDGYEITSESKTWIDRMVRVYLKYYSNVKNEEAEYCMGTFLIDTKTFTLDETNDSLSVTLVDLMAKLDGTYGGELGQEEVVIPMEEPVFDDDGNPVPKRDEQGNIIYQTDEDGNPIIDPDTGEPIPEQATKPTTIRDAMIKTIALAGIKEYIIDDIGAYDREHMKDNYTRYFDYAQLIDESNWNYYTQYEYKGAYGDDYEQCTYDFPYLQYGVMDDGVDYRQKVVLRFNTYDNQGNYYSYTEPMCRRGFDRPYAFYYNDDHHLVLERQSDLDADGILREFDEVYGDEYSGNIYDSVLSAYVDNIDECIEKYNVSHVDVFKNYNKPLGNPSDPPDLICYHIILYHNSGNRLVIGEAGSNQEIHCSSKGGMSEIILNMDKENPTCSSSSGSFSEMCHNNYFPQLNNRPPMPNPETEPEEYSEWAEEWTPHILHVTGVTSHIYVTNFICNKYHTTDGVIAFDNTCMCCPSENGEYTHLPSGAQNMQIINDFAQYSNTYCSFPIFDSKEHADAFLETGATEGILNQGKTYNDIELRYSVDQPFELIYYQGDTVDDSTFYYIYAVSNDLNHDVTARVRRITNVKRLSDDVVVDYVEDIVEGNAYQRGTYFPYDSMGHEYIGLEPFVTVRNLEDKKPWILNNLKMFDSVDHVVGYITYGKEDGMTDPFAKKDNVIPYDIKIDGGTCVLDIVKELRDLYPGYETYFDPNGVFHCHLIPTCADDDYTLKAKDFEEEIAIYSEQRNYAYSSVKNVVQVYGEEYEDIDWYADESNSAYEEGTCTLRVDFTKEKFRGYEDGMLLAIKLQEANPPGFHIRCVGLPPVNTENPTTPSNSEEEEPYAYGPVRVMYSVDENKKLEKGYLLKDVVYILTYKKGNFEYVSSFQPKGLAILLSHDIPNEEKKKWCEKYNVSDASFVIDQDNPFTTDCINIHYTKNVETKDMQIIRSDEEALAFAEYELWRMGRLPNTITLSTDVVPFLDVNQKIEYKHIRSGETFAYITKNISIDISETSAQASITATTFNSLYPEIIGNPNRYRHEGGV